MARISFLEEKDLDSDLYELYAKTGRQNIFLIMAHAQDLLRAFSTMGGALWGKTSLAPMDREMIILAAAHLERGDYEWVQHAAIARDELQMDAAWIEAIARGDFTSSIFGEREQALLAFVRQTVLSVRVDNFVFSTVSKYFDEKKIVEILYLIGYYQTLTRISEVAELPGPTETTGHLVLKMVKEQAVSA